MRKHTPIPLYAAALLLALWVITARSGSVPGLRCAEDYRAMIAEIERNRQAEIVHINDLLVTATGDERDALLAMREESWDKEERERAIADSFLRDCQKAARGYS